MARKPRIINTKIKVWKNQINYRVDFNGGDMAPFQKENLKIHFSIARIFHRVLNAYRLSQIEIFEKNDFEILGETLGKILFESNPSPMHKDLNNLLRKFRDVYLEKDARCRIYLEFSEDAGTAAMLPWEYIQLKLDLVHNKELFIYPAADEDAKFDFIRSIPSNDEFDPGEPGDNFTVMLVVASCNGPYNVDADRILDNWCKQLTIASSNKIKFIPLSVPYDTMNNQREHSFVTALKAALKNVSGPYVLHYLGHGTVTNCVGSLSFVGNDSEASWIEDKRFAAFFDDPNLRKPHIICLQACSSGQIPQFDERKEGERELQMRGVGLNLALHGIPAVVAMQNDITEQDSFAFFEKFYESLVRGLDVAEAVTIGRTYLGTSYKKFDAQGKNIEPFYNSNTFGTPVLFLSATEPFALVEVEEQAVPVSISYHYCPGCQQVLEDYPGTVHLECPVKSGSLLIPTTKEFSDAQKKNLTEVQHIQGAGAMAGGSASAGAMAGGMEKSVAGVQDHRAGNNSVNKSFSPNSQR